MYEQVTVTGWRKGDEVISKIKLLLFIRLIEYLKRVSIYFSSILSKLYVQLPFNFLVHCNETLPSFSGSFTIIEQYFL
jgi:hypothetical protein